MKISHGIRRHFRKFHWLAAIAAGASLASGQQTPPSQPVEARVENLLSQLTLEEKVSLLHAKSTFSVAGVPRLGIPELWMDDGPMGVREEVGEGFRNLGRTNDFATAMPASLGLAATFNTDLANAYGAVIGQEARQRGKNIMLGPSLCIQRTPLCGRNFEYMGEDPYLAARIAVNYIQGEQAQGVSSCAKHFAANNQEVQRGSINVEMDERTLREIYLPAFRAAVQEGGALSVMGAYNELRGQHCCENDYLLNKILKGEWGFKGVVVSDWGGVHNTDLAATNGMDIEMGSGANYDNYKLANPYLAKLKSGDLPTASLDDKVRRHLYVMFKLGMIHDPGAPAVTNAAPTNDLSTKAHQEVARRVAEESIVLLKNDGLLPLDASRYKSIAVIGVNAATKFASGGGAANIKAPYEITALAGISNRVNGGAQITYSPGYAGPGGRGGGRRGGAGGGEAAPVVNPNLAADAVAAAKAADLVIFVGGLSHNGGYDAEGGDRRDMKLPGGQDDLLGKILEANPKTVVVFNGGGAVEMGDWLAKAPALLYAWYGGLEGGNALARVLFGDVNACGKLPCTFPKRLADSPAHALNAAETPPHATNAFYPGANGVVTYAEGLLVGYRWFDAKQIEPLFPFGHGLSYTSFKYSNLKLTGGNDPANPAVTVEFDLANTGARAGAEVAQIYAQEENPSVSRPPKELKGFAKAALQPGETRRITVRLDRSAFAFYDPGKKGWVAEKGAYKILVGSSSRDIRLQDECQLKETVFTPDTPAGGGGL
ncbi:MAG: glycoside hydrolase family 3 C-terminal domain-containing protein [Verrucomicrobiota bacterium]|jgi:beta-glucosidase